MESALDRNELVGARDNDAVHKDKSTDRIFSMDSFRFVASQCITCVCCVCVCVREFHSSARETGAAHRHRTDAAIDEWLTGRAIICPRTRTTRMLEMGQNDGDDQKPWATARGYPWKGWDCFHCLRQRVQVVLSQSRRKCRRLAKLCCCHVPDITSSLHLSVCVAGVGRQTSSRFACQTQKRGVGPRASKGRKRVLSGHRKRLIEFQHTPHNGVDVIENCPYNMPLSVSILVLLRENMAEVLKQSCACTAKNWAFRNNL